MRTIYIAMYSSCTNCDHGIAQWPVFHGRSRRDGDRIEQPGTIVVESDAFAGVVQW